MDASLPRVARRVVALVAALAAFAPALPFASSTLPAQGPPPSPPSPGERRLLVRASRLVDGAADEMRRDQGILIVGDRIARVGPYPEIAAAAGNAE
ncbi:MAG: hypothetical protein ACREON_09340, partial [Gemmatimonadaceae bacterium]